MSLCRPDLSKLQNKKKLTPFASGTFMVTEMKATYRGSQIKEVSKQTQMSLLYRLQKDGKTY